MPDSELAVGPMVDRLNAALRNELAKRGIADPAMLGIHTGGAWIAAELHRRLALTTPLGLLNIGFYRDDFSQIGMHPQVSPSSLPFRVDGRDIILVDDVLYTGRTIRAALNEIFDYGRPAQVVLAVLVDRNGRQIPVQADCVGTRMELLAGRRVKLSGPEPLRVSIQSV